MGHVVHIENREHFIKALEVLDGLPGTWHSRGSAESPDLLVLDSHYQALVKAGVIPANGKEEKGRGKKARAKSIQS